MRHACQPPQHTCHAVQWKTREHLNCNNRVVLHQRWQALGHHALRQATLCRQRMHHLGPPSMSEDFGTAVETYTLRSSITTNTCSAPTLQSACHLPHALTLCHGAAHATSCDNLFCAYGASLIVVEGALRMTSTAHCIMRSCSKCTMTQSSQRQRGGTCCWCAGSSGASSACARITCAGGPAAHAGRPSARTGRCSQRSSPGSGASTCGGRAVGAAGPQHTLA